MKNIVRIQLDRQEYEISEIPDSYLNLGGRGLTSSIIAQEVPPECDALGQKNKLVIAGGILAGTAVPNSGRLSIGAKSPMTGTIKETNAGGTAAEKLARLGIQAIVLEGIGSELVSIKIEKDKVSFTSARDLSMLGNEALIKQFREIYGERIAVISIGQAGELGLKAAAVSVTSPDFLPRMAGRGGLGAVMGAKNVKALIIDDSEGAPVKPKEEALYKASVKAFTKGLLSHPLIENFKQYGTPMLVGMINEIGALPTQNFSQGSFEAAGKISGEYIVKRIQSRPNAKTSHRCMNGCVISCSNVYTDEKGMLIVSGLEYETLALMGANCLIKDIDIIARMNAICNDIGVDTMDVGGALAVAMEAGMIPWGDGQKALHLVEEIAKDTEAGRLIGNGCKYAGDALKVKRIPHVKGQCISGYDPRILKGTGVTYATSTMGADHTCGNALPSPTNPAYDPSAAKGQAPVSKFLQQFFSAIDTLGLCLFAALPMLDIPELQEKLIDCVSQILDEPLGEDYLMHLGSIVLKEERKFNVSVGFGQKEDRLPGFFSIEPLMPSGNTFDVGDEELDSVHK